MKINSLKVNHGIKTQRAELGSDLDQNDNTSLRRVHRHGNASQRHKQPPNEDSAAWGELPPQDTVEQVGERLKKAARAQRLVDMENEKVKTEEDVRQSAAQEPLLNAPQAMKQRIDLQHRSGASLYRDMTSNRDTRPLSGPPRI